MGASLDARPADARPTFDVVVVGAGPTGLMLACELQLAGVHALVLEKRLSDEGPPRANGINGQILRILGHRGLLERLESISAVPTRAVGFPFGGVQAGPPAGVESPLRALALPQHRLEEILAERALELGAEIRRGQDVTGLAESADTVSVEVRSSEGPFQLAARYVVGCDGPRSAIRNAAAIRFPGTTSPEVNRLGQLALGDSVTVSGEGDLQVPGRGILRAGFTRTERGTFSFGITRSGGVLVQTTENEPVEYWDDVMSLGELHDSIHRVLGFGVPLGEPKRLSRYQLQARLAEGYRRGRVLLAGDAAHQFPATGIGLNVGMTDAVDLGWKIAAALAGWAPPGLLDSYGEERTQAAERAMFQTQAQVALRRGNDAASQALRDLFLEVLHDEQSFGRVAAMIAGTDQAYVTMSGPSPTGFLAPDLTLVEPRDAARLAELMREAKPVFLDLAGRVECQRVFRAWEPRGEILAATAVDRPADALLLRPDGWVAWSTAPGESDVVALPLLRDALARWFGGG